MEDELNAKLRAEREYLAGQAQVRGLGASPANYDTCSNEKATGEELLIHQLLRKKRKAESDHDKLDRAIGILERHPEFQEFIELLRSGLV